MNRIRGLWHVRRLWLGLTLTLAMAGAAWLFFDMAIRIQPVTEELVRAVGAPEMFGATLAALLPAVCLPTFNGRERIAGPSARRVHTALSATLLLGPLLVFFAWYQSIGWHVPSENLPPAHQFAGNLLALAALGLVSTLMLGPRLGPPATLLAFAGLVMLQQAWPESLLSTQFSVGRRWTTNWWLTAAICFFAVTLNHHLRSVPRRSTRFD